MNIGIFGAGFVGTTMGLLLSELGHKVTCVDRDAARIRLLQKGQPCFFEPDVEPALGRQSKSGNLSFSTDDRHAIEENEVIFICVGTPSNPDGSADLTQIRQVCRSIGRWMNGYKVIINKSTSPVGTCEHVRRWIGFEQRHLVHFDVVANPEFLREGTALSDARHPERIVIGSGSPHATAVVKSLYCSMTCPFIVTSTRTAEMIKYASNAFLATKISYVNQLARLCDSLNVNIKEVTAGMGLDARIGKQFLRAGLGYGGSCFPKDVKALIASAHELGMTFDILEDVHSVNEEQCFYFLNHVQRGLGTCRNKTIAVFGLSFKPGTSDTRESPALSVIRELITRQAIVKAHDPVAKLPKEFSGPVTQCKSPEETAGGTDAVLVCTEWPDYKALDWVRIKQRMRGSRVFDGRNMLDPAYMTSLGFTYQGIGQS